MRSHAVGRTDSLLIEDTMGRCFEAVARRFPQRDAVVARHQRRRLTYAELDAESNRLASALLRLGLVAGDRAGIWAGNGYEGLLLQLATAKVGIVLVNIDPAWRPAQREHALQATACRLLATMGDVAGGELGVAPSLQGGRHDAAGPRATRQRQAAWMVQIGERHEPGALPFADLMASGRPDDPAVRAAGAALRATDAIAIQFTGGTGLPRGATLTHRQLLNNGFFAGEAMRLREDDRVCIPVPLHHGFGMVLGNLAGLTHGAALVYPSATFDALAVLQAVHEERCTALHGGPAMFLAELAHPRFTAFDLSSLRTGIVAGGRRPPDLVHRLVERMHLAQVTVAHGMAEAGPVSCQTSTATPLALRATTVGRVHPHVEIKLADPATGETVPLGLAGELCTRGYAVMHGYWDDPAGTAEVMDAQGWMHTGELATMDAGGYLRIVGRLDPGRRGERKGKWRSAAAEPAQGAGSSLQQAPSLRHAGGR